MSDTSRFGADAIAVKICGLSDPAGLDAAVSNGADWAGFVFFARSPRAVEPARVASLCARHPGAIRLIGLFVRPQDDEIGRCLDLVRLDGLQIYDTVQRSQQIRQHFGVPVWHACGISASSDLPRVSTADRLVVESRPPPGSDRPGGNGVAFDWTMLRDWHAPCPWILGGGLDPDNVATAIERSRAAAVDVSSGVESGPGVKDPDKIAAFIKAARTAVSGS